jgi:hypothetical protein
MKQRGAWLAWMLVGMLAFVQGAWAQSPGAVRKQVEGSMLVTGMITIRADGGVAAVELDKQDRLPEGIAPFVTQVATSWRFEPVLIEGVARQVRTRMSARLLAKPTGDGKMQVSVRSADFGDYEATPVEERISRKRLMPPGYPTAAARAGAQGTVYLLLKIGREGVVEDVAAEQVNLRMVASEAQMRQFRERFARAAIAAAESWTFNPPTRGEAAEQPYWVVRVPVDFSFRETRPYGQWEGYVPGPRERVSWAQQEDRPGFSPDVLADGGLHMEGGKQGPRLLTPLDGV